MLVLLFNLFHEIENTIIQLQQTMIYIRRQFSLLRSVTLFSHIW